MTFRFEQLTIKGKEAVGRAQSLATEAGNPQIEALHLLAGSHPRPARVLEFRCFAGMTIEERVNQESMKIMWKYIAKVGGGRHWLVNTK